MRIRNTYSVSLAIVSLLLSSLGRSEEPAQEDALRRKRGEFLTAQIAEFDLRLDEEGAKPLARTKTPVSRWSNPVREFVNDGLTYLWLDGNRPVAMISCWVRGTDPRLRSGELWRGFVSLSGKPMTLRRGNQVLWSPRTRSLLDQPLMDAPAPQAVPALRLTQMREIARRFRATSYKMESPHELRLLPRPLYRFEDKDAGVLDGALFVFVEGNDSEAGLLLEAVTIDGGRTYQWQYALVRLTSYRVVVRLDNREVFEVPPYWKGPRSPSDDYLEAKDGPYTLDDVAPRSRNQTDR
jgi:hypothetical protein